ncbi:MAG: DNA alkylation repair protein [Chloroflexi bacterium]|nr:DNA alkylation repair protein [Chloroflexota bacterium]
MKKDTISAIRQELKQQADTGTGESVQAFFKEKVTAYGVKTATVIKIARKYLKEIKPLGKREIFKLSGELLKSDYIEEAFIAFEWAYRLRDEYEPGDFVVFERWLKGYVNNWAKCDSLCNHTIGSFVEKYPRYIANLKGWAGSENRWLRRAAAVTLIVPAKRGKFLKDTFEIADILLQDKDDLVQKGYGWMLKEASRMHRDEVFDYVLRNRRLIPRTALRYAIEKMPEDSRRLAMEKN